MYSDRLQQHSVNHNDAVKPFKFRVIKLIKLVIDVRELLDAFITLLFYVFLEVSDSHVPLLSEPLLFSNVFFKLFLIELNFAHIGL